MPVFFDGTLNVLCCLKNVKRIWKIRFFVLGDWIVNVNVFLFYDLFIQFETFKNEFECVSVKIDDNLGVTLIA